MSRLRVLTWHVHGSYLYYLSQADCDFILPTRDGGADGYGGRAGSFGWGDNVFEVPAQQVRHIDFDLVLCQTKRNWLIDREELLSREQRGLPCIYLEHDPPREHPTDTTHVVDDPDVLLVHVTHFNDLMWDSGRTPTRVIEHGVKVPDWVHYRGDLGRGLVVINQLAKRGRRLGADIFTDVRERVPLDLVGMEAKAMGGLGEVPLPQLPDFTARYRFLFNPIRYTSLGLAVCEAMTIGVPIVGLATTEMATVVENGVNGYVDTDVDALVERMQELLDDHALALRLSEGARRTALDRFSIKRFSHDWEQTFREVTGASARRPVRLAL